ncbi:hypothetical protein GCM10020295_73070 [Streptomyces cinereospinus]
MSNRPSACANRALGRAAASWYGEFAAAAAVPLTSVRRPAVRMGALAAGLLLEESGRDGGPARHEHRRVVLQPELVVRRSRLPGR